MKNIFFIILLIFIVSLTKAQQSEPRLIQFNGLVTTYDSSNAIPYANIKVLHTYRGTVSNTQGFFTIVVTESDTIEISAVGFKKKRIYIPEGQNEFSVTMVIALKTDTITYNETAIYPWPSRDRFKQAFLTLEVNKTFVDLAMENLDQGKLLTLSSAMKMDGSENQHYYMNNMAIKSGYLGGQTNYAIFPGTSFPVPLSLMNPFAWAELIKAIKEGKFKKK